MKNKLPWEEEFVKVLQEINDDYPEWEVNSYSGRNMYGKRCLAITGKIDLIELGMIIGKRMSFPILPNRLGTKTDSMGHDIIIYWPSIPYEDEDEEE